MSVVDVSDFWFVDGGRLDSMGEWNSGVSLESISSMGCFVGSVLCALELGLVSESDNVSDSVDLPFQNIKYMTQFRL